MKSHTSFLVLLSLAMEYNFTEGQSSVTLTLTSPVDVTSGNTICPNTKVEFTCIGISVTASTWRRNGMDIDAFNVLSGLGRREPVDPFITFLDVNTGDPANMTSRLVFNVSDVMSGDTIDCITSGGGRTVTLNYETIAPPGELQTNDHLLNIISKLNFNISWNPVFTSQYNVTFYRVNITQSSIARCQTVCVSFEPCQCTMPAVGEVANISISATNCGNQEGPAIVLEAQARLPSPPSECLGLPVYNYTSDLTGIYFHWMRVNDPPEFTTGVRQDITHYSVSVRGDAVQTIPATTACPTVNCSSLFPLDVDSLSISSFRGDVSANNVIGPGPSCPTRMEADSRNQVFTLRISSTNPTNQTVECTQQSGTIGTFDCDFCYNPLSSCWRTTFNFCQVITESLSLSSLNEVTYCYRATARINGTSVAMIQGNFSTGCLPQDLGVDQPSNVSSGTFPIFGGRVSYNGTIEGAVATYQCDGGYSLSGNVERVCQSDGNWNGQIP